MPDVQKLLDDRERTYGIFENHADIAQALKGIMHAEASWGSSLDADMKEALEMIQHKIARILNGDPFYADNWVDIAGYAQLVANRVIKLPGHGNNPIVVSPKE